MAYRSPFGGSYGGEVKIVEVSNTITIDGVEIENTPEAIHAFHENRKRNLEAIRKAENEREEKARLEKVVYCPLDRFSNSPPICRKDCSLYRGDKCAFSRNKPAPDTLGKKCPLFRKCSEQCALYNGGCTI